MLISIHVPAQGTTTARTVYNWAKGELTEFTGVENPFSALRLKSPPGRDVVWTEDQVRAMAAKAVEMGRPSIALAVRVAYETFQRATDNLQLRRDQYRDGAFLIRQSKTGTAVRIPIADRELCAAVEAVTSEYLFVSESTGRPYAEPHFRYWFKKIKKAAGLPKELQFRDNRRSTLTELGDAGATDDEIRAASGHLSREVVAKYVKRTNVQAQNAVNKRQIFRISQKGVSELKVIDGGKLLAAK